MEKIQKDLFAMQDIKYKAFQQKLMLTVDPACVIGVRTPQLRKYAAQLSGTLEAEAFLRALPHQYYEENNLHGFLIERIRDYGEAMRETEKFLPYVDNWATCDGFLPKVFRKYKAEVYEKAQAWIHSDEPYTIRYGIRVLMENYLDEDFRPEMMELVAGVRSEEYYVNMMCAWYMATALAKQYDTAIIYIEENRFPKWVHNKSIQKAVESRRISRETKEYLKGMRRK